MKFSMGRLVVPMTWVVLSPVVVSSALAGMPVGPATPPEQEAKQKASAEPSTDAIIYTNTKYGFRFALPEGWKGYSVVTDQWEATDAQKGVVERGPIVYIRHPDWTKENARQDIPIMVFTLTQWESVEHGDFFIGGAAIVPGELGRNRKYAFAVSRRVEETDAAGAKEVNEILEHDPLHPIWSK
ncbi:MAG: hypothetical protein WA671_16220 [Candidatus Sulfotelmatobacter sp.]